MKTVSKSMYRKMIKCNKLCSELRALNIEIIDYLQSIGIKTDEGRTEELLGDVLGYGSADKKEVDLMLEELNLKVK